MPPKKSQVERPPGQGRSRSARRRRARRSKTVTVPRDVITRPVQPRPVAADVFSKQYAALLDDPFSHEPMKLGFGTLVDTRIGTARITQKLTANATDGSLLIVVGPNAQSPMAYSGQGTSVTPVFATITDDSWTSASAEFSSARPIALGIRVAPLSSANDKCSRVVGSLLSYDLTQDSTAYAALNGYFHQNWFASHLGSKVILPSGGNASSLNTWRPMSLTNFQFNSQFLKRTPASGTTTGFQNLGPSIVLAIAGPASMDYDVEVIYYYEALAAANSMYAGVDSMTDKASNFFPSLEKFYNAASQYMNDDNVTRLIGVGSAAANLWHKYRIQNNLLPWHGGAFHSISNVDDDDKHPPTSSPISTTSRASLLRELSQIAGSHGSPGTRTGGSRRI